MSRSNNERTSSKHSKMDRYTEDLKYSLRSQLSESVGKGALRTNDILARGHRQIVADFTDPRQWYYSATHDYVIALMRESQKQNGGSVWGSGSRRRDRGSSTSRRHSSSATHVNDVRPRRKKELFVEIPATTSDDLQQIRGSAEKTSDTKLKKDYISGEGIDLEGSVSLTQTQNSKETTDNGEDNEIALLDYLVPGSISPEGKSNIVSKQDATVPLRVNNDHNISVLSQDCAGSDIPSNTSVEKSSTKYQDKSVGIHSKFVTDMESMRESCEDEAIVDEYNVAAMEAYRASKQSQNSCIPSKKQKVPAAYGDTHSYYPGRLESFEPMGKRGRAGPSLKTAVSLPQIGKNIQTEQPEFPRKNRYKVRRGRVGSRKLRLCPLTGLERVSDKTGDLPYVEDWIRKLQINGKDLGSDKHLEPIERVDETFPFMSQQRPQMASAVQQLMELPTDFKPVTGFQPFQPHPSLYLYSLKQKSDLNVKLQYLDIPKPVKQQTDPGIQQKHSFKDDLTKVRSKVNYIEDRLGELYKSEANLDRIVSRQQIKPLKKQNGRFIGITPGITNRNPDSNSSEERPVDNSGACLPKVPAAKDPANLPKVADEHDKGHDSKMNTISLALSSNETHFATRDDGPSNPESESLTQGEDFHATSTSSWKQPYPVSPGRQKSGRAVKGKILRVFDKRGVGNGDQYVNHTSKVLKDDPEEAIASVHECNASGSGIDPQKQEHPGFETEDEELDGKTTGSRLSALVLEVLNDLMDHLELPGDISDYGTLSSNFGAGGASSTEEIPGQMAQDTSTREESPSPIKEEGNQEAINLVRLCSFCDEPHELT